MATATKSTKSTKAAEAEVTEVELSVKQLINAGIDQVVEATGVDSQKARYKAMRAIAYTAFAAAIEDGTFDDLVESAINGADDLPSGWQLERSVAAEKPAKAPAKKAAAKPAAKSASAKPAARKRPTR